MASLAHKAFLLLLDRHMVLVTAESCTGGMIAAALTDISGSSQVLDRGFVTYSNAAKIELLGVSSEQLESFGAVSKEVAIAMAEGALKNSNATLAVSVTGIAGPTGGTAAKPVGTVHFGLAANGHETIHDAQAFPNISRQDIRLAAREHALALVCRFLDPASV